jgi:sarcosine oxidase subunit gamma
VSAVSLTGAADGLSRFGVKGPQAAAWLATRGVALPQAPNGWCVTDDGVCLRLGRGEYFGEGGDRVAGLASELVSGAGVYPVLRQDACVVLAGSDAEVILAQGCAYDFAKQPPDAVVLTSMLGVSAQVIWRAAGGGRAYQLWCDASFGPYFTATLAGIVRENGGTVSLPQAGRKGSVEG